MSCLLSSLPAPNTPPGTDRSKRVFLIPYQDTHRRSSSSQLLLPASPLLPLRLLPAPGSPLPGSPLGLPHPAPLLRLGPLPEMPDYLPLSVWGKPPPSLPGGAVSKLCLQERPLPTSTPPSPAPAPSSGDPALCEGIFVDTVFYQDPFFLLETSKAVSPLPPTEATWTQSL